MSTSPSPRRFILHSTTLEGAGILERQPRGDDRGYLERIYCPEIFAELGLFTEIRQINHTLTRHAGTVRGLHFQNPPHLEAKLVTCLRGRVYDVAVDLRRHSPTFLQWHAVTLSGEGFQSYYIPAGFAHGFQTLTEDCELLYLHSASHATEAEGGISATDPRLAIPWPLPISQQSPRDAAFPALPADWPGILLASS